MTEPQQEPSTEWKQFVSELRHRLMNYLQMITSVINVQVTQVQDPKVATALRAAQNRVRAITGLLGLHSTPDLTMVHLGEYLQWLVRELMAEYGVTDRIETDVRTSDMAVTVNEAIPLALLVNELVANAVEHAFPGEVSGKIRVRLDYAMSSPNGTNATDYGELEISDNGKPVLQSAEFHSGGKTGFTLVRGLTRQLHAKLALENFAEEKIFRLTFPLTTEK